MEVLDSTINLRSLHDYIEQTSLECLNQTDFHPVDHAINAEDPSLYVESCTDPELLFQLSFRAPIRLEQIRIGVAKVDNEWNLSFAPSNVKLYINHINMDFNNIESSKCVYQKKLQVHDYVDQQLAIISLSPAKFRHVKSIALFFEAPIGNTDIMRIARLEFWGKPVESTNIKEWVCTKNSQESNDALTVS